MKRSINEKVKLDTSEKLKKTPRKDRNKIVYRFYNEKGTEIIEIRPGEDGVTEIDLQNFYSAEDHEIYENLKARRPELTKEERLEIQKFRKQFISKYTKKYSRTSGCRKIPWIFVSGEITYRTTLGKSKGLSRQRKDDIRVTFRNGQEIKA